MSCTNPLSHFPPPTTCLQTAENFNSFITNNFHWLLCYTYLSGVEAVAARYSCLSTGVTAPPPHPPCASAEGSGAPPPLPSSSAEGSDTLPPLPATSAEGRDSPPPLPSASVEGSDIPPPLPDTSAEGCDSPPPLPSASAEGSDIPPNPDALASFFRPFLAEISAHRQGGRHIQWGPGYSEGARQGTPPSMWEVHSGWALNKPPRGVRGRALRTSYHTEK